MKRFAFVLLSGLAGACAMGAEPSGANLHNLMKNTIAPQTQVIWDTGNTAQDDKGDIDPAKLKPADWARLTAAATQVKKAAETLAKSAHVTAASPGVKLQDEENPGAFKAADVQKVIDAQPKVLNAMAQALATNMDQILAAIGRKDGHKLAELSGEVDEVCEACHKVFWYPNQK